ncbi:unnamed protein product [Brassicogethes aeneus]|uniref:Fibroblast growth factor n=1 Tax=Brassicogethes aeneus TaxID=1431903 RepID=A0A9P0BIQ3_BRAAE|nr:unnamed protein product [Brassicogethes aeneus]
MNNPFGNKYKLYSETGYNLTIRNDGTILGTKDDFDPDVNLQILQGDEVGHVRIQGVSTNLFVCFNKNGKLYGEADKNKFGTIFEESFAGSYTSYRSVAYPDWYLGIKKSGLTKRGPKTLWGTRSTKFLPRRWQLE